MTAYIIIAVLVILGIPSIVGPIVAARFLQRATDFPRNMSRAVDESASQQLWGQSARFAEAMITILAASTGKHLAFQISHSEQRPKDGVVQISLPDTEATRLMLELFTLLMWAQYWMRPWRIGSLPGCIAWGLFMRFGVDSLKTVSSEDVVRLARKLCLS